MLQHRQALSKEAYPTHSFYIITRSSSLYVRAFYLYGYGMKLKSNDKLMI